MPTLRALNDLSEERFAICRQCDRFDSIMVRCRKCKCFLAAKTRFPGAKCPIGLWNKDDIRARETKLRLIELQNESNANPDA